VPEPRARAQGLRIGLALALAAVVARGQASNGTMPLAFENDEKPEWSFALPTYAYVVPDGRDYLQPTLLADRQQLHLEARWNYEGADSGSLWVGCNFAGGEEWTWTFTPMAGVVFGDTRGLAPGYRGSLGWSGFELYSEGEYLFDSEHASDSFFYNWSELTWSPTDAFRFGLVAQHTRLYQSDRDIHRGVLAGLALERLDLTVTVLDPDDEATWIVGLGFAF